MTKRDGKVSNKSWVDIPAVDIDEHDLEKKVRSERKKKDGQAVLLCLF